MYDAPATYQHSDVFICSLHIPEGLFEKLQNVPRRVFENAKSCLQQDSFIKMTLHVYDNVCIATTISQDPDKTGITATIPVLFYKKETF